MSNSYRPTIANLESLETLIELEANYDKALRWVFKEDWEKAREYLRESYKKIKSVDSYGTDRELNLRFIRRLKVVGEWEKVLSLVEVDSYSILGALQELVLTSDRAEVIMHELNMGLREVSLSKCETRDVTAVKNIITKIWNLPL